MNKLAVGQVWTAGYGPQYQILGFWDDKVWVNMHFPGVSSKGQPKNNPSTMSRKSFELQSMQLLYTLPEHHRSTNDYDASNAVRLCELCEKECGVGAGADKGDMACAVCGRSSAPHIYPKLTE